MAFNFWFEHVIDAWLKACAEGRDWEEAVAEAERTIGDKPRRVLTRVDLREKKGIPFSRQYIAEKVRERTFPPPFQAPV
jgi:predicted anti-sigma-YlaC factor YlaD